MRVPVASDLVHAARVSLGLLIPGVTLVAAGEPDLIIYAVFGSFAGMYGRADSRPLRLLHQSQGAVLLLSGALAGVLLSQAHAGGAFVVLLATVWAVGGSLVADYFGLRPEGPFYGVFALGALAGVPAGLASPSVLMLIACGGALVALAIGLVARGVPAPYGTSLADRFREHRQRDRAAAVTHAIRYGSAVLVAGGVALVLGLGHVNWAIAGAAVTLAAADPRGRVRRATHRVVGTVVGLAVTALVLAPGFPPLALAVIVICLLFPTELFMAVNYALALSFFTPMIMLMAELAHPIGVRELVTDRGLGTLVGVAVALVVNWAIRDADPGDTKGPANGA